MNKQELQDFIIKKYQDEERMMVHLFIEWCCENKLDPHTIYQLAYPNQEKNPVITELMENLTDQQPLHIPNETLLDILQVFGNDELAFVIADLLESKNAD